MSETELQWDVTVDRQLACATPCQLWIPPLAFVTMHSQEPHSVRLPVGYLPQANDVVVSAEPVARGAFATGVTFTALGGAALVTGITLGAVGYGTSDQGMKTAGMVTGVSGAIVLGGAIWLVNWALPHAHVRTNGTF